MVTALAVCALWLLNLLWPVLASMSPFIIASLLVFAGFNVFSYYLGVRAAASQSPNRFIQLVMVLMILKMGLCIALVVGYINLAQPDSKLFVLPFLSLYVIFTIFEVWALMRVARVRNITPDQ